MSLNSNSANNSNTNLNNNYNNSQQQQCTNSNVILQTLKRRATKTVVPLEERVTLEKAFGFTINSNAKLTRSNNGLIAYIAGCVIVVYDTNEFKQEFIISKERKTLTTLSFSNDNRFIVTGESGHDPKVRLWDVKEKTQIAEFAGHKFAIECVCFTPNSNMIISVGSVHDMVINVWNCKTKFKVASNKVSCKVKAIAFSRDGSYFVTVGNRHVKFWYLTVSTLMETVPLKGRAAILNDMKNNYYCDVVCGSSNECAHLTYILTTNGILCEFDENRSLSRVIELRVDRAYCICADDENLYIGCSNSTILMFKQNTLEFVASLPRSHHLGVDISKYTDTRHLVENLNNYNLKYPDCIGLCYNASEYYLCAIYNDHSFYIWDIRDVNKVKKVVSHLYHSSCCWSLDIFSNLTANHISNLPHDTFITCSTDNTIRFWTLNPCASKNIYSKELLNLLYINNDLSALCNSDSLLNINQEDTINTNTSTINSNNSTNTGSETSKLGAKCLKVNPFGTQLATGDRNGNIRIYDLKHMESIVVIEAHESEILYLQYSPPESGYLYLASSSRDRIIHIFDAKRNYELIQTLGDHSAAITATRFNYNIIDKQFYIISCGYDKSIIVRTAVETDNSTQRVQFQRTSYVAEKQTFYDLIVDPTRNYVNTISQDRMIRTYSIKDGKKLRQIKGSLNDDGYLIKMDMDATGTLLATSCSDKCVYIWDLNTAECVAQICGHSEIICDLKFTHNNKYLITVSVDGCIFVWRLNYLSMGNSQAASLTHPTVSTVTNTASVAAQIKKFSQTSRCVTPTYSDSTQNESVKSRLSNNLLSDLFSSATNTVMSTPSTTNDVSSFTEFSSLTTTTTTNAINTSQNAKQQVRRPSRAVWGPVCNTSFAIMVDNDLDDNFENDDDDDKDVSISTPCVATSIHQPLTSHTPSGKIKTFLTGSNSANSILSEMSLPVVQFPSPIVEKDLYHVVTVDTSSHLYDNNQSKVHNSSFTNDDNREDEQQDTCSLSPRVEKECLPCALNEFNESISNKSINQQEANRRQSLSARYLLKTQVESPLSTSQLTATIEQIDEYPLHQQTIPHQIEQHNMQVHKTPTHNTIPTSVPSANFVCTQTTSTDFFKIRKNKSTNQLQMTSLHFQHTESSLNKIRARQAQHGDLVVESITADDLLNEQHKQLTSNSVKSSPVKTHPPEHHTDTLKKTASLLTLNSTTTQQPHHLSSSASFNNSNHIDNSSSFDITQTTANQLPPRSSRQIKSASTNGKAVVTNNNTATRPTTRSLLKSSNESSIVSTRIRKLSNSIQNLQLTKSPSSDLKSTSSSSSSTTRRMISINASSSSTKKSLKYRRSNTDDINSRIGAITLDDNTACDDHTFSAVLSLASNSIYNYETYLIDCDRTTHFLEQLNSRVFLENLSEPQEEEVYKNLSKHNLLTIQALEFLKTRRTERLTINAT